MAASCQVDFYVLTNPDQSAERLACQLAMMAWEQGHRVSYIGAAIQETVSASLIESGASTLDGLKVYDFDAAITFWITSSVVSMLLAASLWNANVRD